MLTQGATGERADCRTESCLFAIRCAPLSCCRRDCRKQPSGIGSCFRSRACKDAEMRSSLAMLFYIDYKCSTQPGFRKTFLVLMLIFAFLVWSPWRPLLCPVFGVCSAPAVRGDSAPQPQSKPRREKRVTRLAPTSDPVEGSALLFKLSSNSSRISQSPQTVLD